MRRLLSAAFVFSVALLALPAYAVEPPIAISVDASGTSLGRISGLAAGSSVAVGDVDADGQPELVVGSPPGPRSNVTIVETDGTFVRTFYPLGSSTRGVTVTVADITGRGSQDIFVAGRSGGAPHVFQYSASGRRLAPGFLAYAFRFRGGVNLATGDVDGDGVDELITAPLGGGGPHVRVFRGDGTKVADAFPFESSFRGGLSLAALDVDGDGADEVAAAPLRDRLGDVVTFEPLTRETLSTTRPFAGFRGGVALAAGDGSAGQPTLITAAQAGGGPQVRVVNPLDGAIAGYDGFPLDQRWRGGVTVAAFDADGDGVRDVFAQPGSIVLTAEQLSTYGARTPTIVGGSNSSWERRTVHTANGDFGISIVKVNLADARLHVQTLTSTRGTCKDDCPVASLKSYVDQVGGFAGINGSYFCPKDYPQCASQDGSTYWMWYNSATKTFVNEEQNQFNTGPLVAFSTANKPYVYLQAKDWPGQATFEQLYGTTLQAVLSNAPALVYNGKLVVRSSELDDKQRTVHSARSGMAIRGQELFLVVASGATVLDLGAVMAALDVDFAMNLDGGGSSALYYGGVYRVGPGRNIPNALVLTTT